MSMLEMFQKSKKLRQVQIHAAKTVRLLLDIPFCEVCIEYQRVDMNTGEDLATVSSGSTRKALGVATYPQE
jgi:hypothetical protein